MIFALSTFFPTLERPVLNRISNRQLLADIRCSTRYDRFVQLLSLCLLSAWNLPQFYDSSSFFDLWYIWLMFLNEFQPVKYEIMSFFFLLSVLASLRDILNLFKKKSNFIWFMLLWSSIVCKSFCLSDANNQLYIFFELYQVDSVIYCLATRLMLLMRDHVASADGGIMLIWLNWDYGD